MPDSPPARPAPLELPAHEVHLWMSDVGEVQRTGLLDAYPALLAPSEAAQAQRFVFERDRMRYLVTRALVRTVLSRYSPVEIEPRDWVFGANAQGCPFVAGPPTGAPAVTFNLSHTQDTVILAVRAGPALGVDIEAWDRRMNLDIADHFFSPSEAAAVRALSPADQGERFMELWTLKESYIKARTLGLSIALDQFSFDLTQPGHIAVAFQAGLADSPQRWSFFQLRPTPRHVIAVCAERVGGRHPTLLLRQVLPLHPHDPSPVATCVSRASAMASE